VGGHEQWIDKFVDETLDLDSDGGLSKIYLQQFQAIGKATSFALAKAKRAKESHYRQDLFDLFFHLELET
jgi:hypothetical protein